MRKLRVTVDGRVYEVVVEGADDVGPAVSMPPAQPLVTSVVTPSSAGVSVSGGGGGPGAGEVSGAVPSPLAGKIVSIDVAAGDRVTEGQRLLTVEAMKMNTLINAPRAGVVREILVAAGDPVQEGQALVALD